MNAHDVRFLAHPIEDDRAAIARNVEVVDDWPGIQLRKWPFLAAGMPGGAM